MTDNLTKLAERFCAAPLPDSVCADPWATIHGQSGRTGTNLLTVAEAEQLLHHVLGDPKTQEPTKPNGWNGYGCYSASLGFEGGNLSIKTAGWGDWNGHGMIAFPGRDMDMDDEGYFAIGLPNSELIAIRDFLNERFPPAPGDPA